MHESQVAIEAENSAFAGNKIMQKVFSLQEKALEAVCAKGTDASSKGDHEGGASQKQRKRWKKDSLLGRNLVGIGIGKTEEKKLPSNGKRNRVGLDCIVGRKPPVTATVVEFQTRIKEVEQHERGGKKEGGGKNLRWSISNNRRKEKAKGRRAYQRVQEKLKGRENEENPLAILCTSLKLRNKLPREERKG